MLHLKRALPISLILSVALTSASLAQPGTLERIEPQGLFRMSEEAFLHALDLEVGDPWDETVVRDRFRVLWELRLFEDIVFEAEDGPEGGKVLVIKVKERPVLTSVTYEDNRVLTRTQIEDRLKERKIGLSLGKPLDMGVVFEAESAIRDLLAERGHLDAEVEAEVRRVTETSRAVHYRITPGGKTRIKDIRFTGNEVFSDRKLKGKLELTEESRWYWPWSQKNLYHPAKWDQDSGKIRDAYQDEGYLDIQVRTPIVEVIRADAKKRPAAAAEAAPDEPAPAPPETTPDKPLAEMTPDERKKWEKRRQQQEKKARKQEQQDKKIKRWVQLSVPVIEGQRYTLGEITFSGNSKFPSELLRAGIPLKEGDILRNGRLQLGIDGITRLYEDRGHLFASVVRRIQRREGEKVADVEVTIDEGDPYQVARIDFNGNTATHDRVLRRELLILEGELFSRSKLQLSQRKINQLGYVQAPEEPGVQPLEGESRVNVTFNIEEQGRNEIQVGGGYSGLEGAFFNGVYSTRNFLGRGQILSAAIQVGGLSSRYQLSFQEPYFLGKPYRLGVSVFRRDTDFGTTLQSTSTGGGFIVGKRLGRFANLDLAYNWESVSSRTVLTSVNSGVGVLQTIETSTRVSSLTPVFSFSTVNNPYRPTRGRAFTASMQVAGGPLGGDSSFIKPILTFTGYRKALGRTYAALHLQGGMIREWDDGSPNDASAIGGVPRFQRFWLGGETLGPRVFETRTITPLRYVELIDGRITDVLGDPRYVRAEDLVNSGGIPVLIEAGGDRFFLIQTEYVFPLNEQVEIAAFLDVGDTLFEDQSWGLDTARVSTGIEVRFNLPIFPVPLRLIYGIPVRELQGDQSSSFTFSIGRSF